MPSPTCCAAVLSTVDSPDRDCLCTVSEKGDFLLSSYLSVSFVWKVYQDCAGTGEAIPEDRTDCRHAPPPPPRRPRAKAPSPTPSPPCAPHYSLFKVIAVGLAVIVGGGVGVVLSYRRQQGRRCLLLHLQVVLVIRHSFQRRRSGCLQVFDLVVGFGDLFLFVFMFL
ncbi:hypothetical protein BS78_04G000500 [Paspalum vaginatum]|nr:hypothetical protein BS78_04G000500 [Paspalum vaginatum]